MLCNKTLDYNAPASIPANKITPTMPPLIVTLTLLVAPEAAVSLLALPVVPLVLLDPLALATTLAPLARLPLPVPVAVAFAVPLQNASLYPMPWAYMHWSKSPTV